MARLFLEKGGIQYDGAFRQAYGTSLTSTEVGNYLVFDNLSSPSFKLTATPSVLRAPVNGIQIAAETTDELSRPNLTIAVASGQFSLRSLVFLNTHGNGIAPLSEPVVVQIGNSPISIPAGSFSQDASGNYVFHGKIGITAIDAEIVPTSDEKGFIFAAYGFNPNLVAATINPLPVTLVVGDDVATADVTATLK